MNKHRYRIIFNASRGLMMAVAEYVKSHTGNASSCTDTPFVQNSHAQCGISPALRPLAFSLLLALGQLSFVLPHAFNINLARAEIFADPNAPKNQQPMVLRSSNGIEVVNIRTPNATGVSHNTYQQFDVPQHGAIINNSRTNVQTQLGGWVNGNPMINSPARIIINEVNSVNPSYLNGFVEIAGTRADFILANPNGITCNGCGFINAHRTTLTTGTPIFNGGDLAGYRVHGGDINIIGNGLDASNTNYTDIIARAVNVNAGVWANNLNVTTGTNTVNASNSQIAAITPDSNRPASGYALDVGALGGMYAKKIVMIGTEAGLGVRNAGTIGASVGDITLTADGQLHQTGSMMSAANTNISVTADINNGGTIYAHGNASLTTQADMINSGMVAAQYNTMLTANGQNSDINSSSSGVLAAGLKADGTLIPLTNGVGNLLINVTQSATIHGQMVAAGDQTIHAAYIDLSDSDTYANALNLNAASGDIQLQNAAIRVNQTLTANTAHTINTNGAGISAHQLNLTAHDLSNIGGELVQTGTGDTSIVLAGLLDNTQGRIATNSQNLTLAAQHFLNTSAHVEHSGLGTLTMTAATFSGNAGQIISNGKLDLTATDIDLSDGSTVANQFQISALTLNHQRGEMIQTGSHSANISATNLLDNTNGLIASNGNMILRMGELDNQAGTIQAAGKASLTIDATGAIVTRELNGVAASIKAAGAIAITADNLDNTLSEITAGDTLTMSMLSNSVGLQNSQGLIASNQALIINMASLDNSSGTLASVYGDADITARNGSIDNHAGQISALNALDINSLGFNNTDGVLSSGIASINTQSQALTNTGGSIVTQADLNLQTGVLTNDNGLIQSGAHLVVNTNNQTLTNSNSGSSKGILALGNSTFTTGNLNNQTGYIGAQGAIVANSAAINNHGGSITGEASITLNGSSLNNQIGRVEALGNVDITTTTHVDNRSGLLRSGQTLSLTSASLDNRNTQAAEQGIEGTSVFIDADQIDNTTGAIRADQALGITSSGTLNNSQGNLSSAGTLNIRDRLASANSNVTGKTLLVTNTGGTIIAGSGNTGDSLTIDSRSMTGDGKVLSQGNLNTKLTTDYTHSGEWQANGNADLTTTDNIINQAKLTAGGNLDINAANLDNQASGEIAGANLNMAVTNTLNNRGLLDGADTFINTTTLNNIGTGRIYGDHVAIAATTLNNVEETRNSITKAAVIAARDRLDIGATNVTNRNDALIFSAGDMAIGGSMDTNHEANVAVGEPKVASLINSGATIEALGNLQLSVTDLQNLNPALVTQEVQIATGSFDRFTPRGANVVLNAEDYPGAQIGNVRISTRRAGPYSFREYYRYLGSTATTATQVVSSNPGQILSGANMTVKGSVTNRDSQMIAGGALDISGATLQNLSTEGKTVKSYSGNAYYYDYDGSGKGFRYKIRNQGAYNPASEISTFSLNIAKLEQNTSFTGTNTQLTALSTGKLTQQGTGSAQANVKINSNNDPAVNTQVPQIASITHSPTGRINSSVSPNTSISNNSLFQTNPDSTAHYLIETDPRFANYRNWLSSDFMLKSLSYDPATVTKRLGDGYYEQRLIREQVGQLTGRRFLTGYANDETQYQALMTNGATFAQAHQLIPGVALSAAQIAQLTSDIVWLVEQTITLPDGTATQALVPQVYIKLQPGDIKSHGSLLAGETVHLNIDNNLENSGTIAGRSIVSINADNIQNLKGRINGNTTNLNAKTDINHLGGSIEAQDALILKAGRDINVASTSQSSQNIAGASSFSRTNLDRVAGLYVNNSNALLVAAAGHNLSLNAANIINHGEQGTTILDAGNNIKLTTLTIAEQNNTIQNSKNYIKHGNTQEIGTMIQTEGDLILNVGSNLTARAAKVTSEQGNLTINAGNDITIEDGKATSNLAAARTTKKSGTFSSKKTETRDTFTDTEVVSSTFSGDSVDIQAGNNLTVTGSNVVGTNNVNLNAGNNVTLNTAQATHDETHYSKTKKSGFTASSTSIGYGSSKLQTTNDTQIVTNVGSTVGSVEGNVNINAGKQYTQTASDVLTPKGDINITAKQVDINAATDSYSNQQSMKYKQSGITVGVSSSALNLAQNVLGTTEAAVKSDSNRNKLLNALQTYANGATLYEQGKGAVNAAKAGNIQDAAGAAGVRLSVSIDSTKAKSSSTTNMTTQQESLIKAGGNVNITATQDDLTIKGSEVIADKNVTLEAAKNINLIASADTESNQSKNKSSSTSIGVSVGVGAGGAGLSVDLAASRGKGSANSDSTTYNNTHITAGETLTLNSGQDTNMIGANAAGKKVIADVGRNLNIQSLQDTATSKAKQSNTGISISVPVASPTLGNTFGAVSQSKQKSNSNYASVYEQSGIKAGEQGFNITTQGNIDLKGAVIESTATVEKNQLTTGTLTVSNIQNHMDAEASSSGTTLNTKMLNSKYEATKAIVGNLQNHGEADISDNSTTRSAIAPANISITDEAKQQQLTGNTAETTIALLDRDTKDTNRVLAKPDVQALQEKAQQEQADRVLLVNTVTAFSDEAFRKAFLQEAKIYKVQRNADGTVALDDDGKPLKVEITPEDKYNLKSGENGKVNVYTNGIYNEADLAASYAAQMSQANAGDIYLVYFPEANNMVSELLIAGYQKFMENSALGLTNATQQIVDLSQYYGGTGLNLVGHSRGGMTIGNALEAQRENGAPDSLSQTKIQLYGSAYNAQNAANHLDALNGDSDTETSNVSVQTHQYDFVGRILGNNPNTGGTIPEGSSVAGEVLNTFIGEISVHNCYGAGKDGCSPLWGGGIPETKIVLPAK